MSYGVAPLPPARPRASESNSARLLFTLDNGLQVAIQEDRFAPVVAVQMWVKAGSADETPDVAGAAHVHEHMLFKGTPSRPVGAIAGEIESSGGTINAFTTADHTVYHVVVASRHFSDGLGVLADAIRNSTFDPGELDKELAAIDPLCARSPAPTRGSSLRSRSGASPRRGASAVDLSRAYASLRGRTDRRHRDDERPDPDHR